MPWIRQAPDQPIVPMMNEQNRHRITGGLFLLALAGIFLPMLFDGDGIATVQVEPIRIDFVPESVPRFETVVPASDFAARAEQLRGEVDDEGIHDATRTRIGEPVLSVPDAATDTWALQVASFVERNNALDYRDRLRNDGYEAFLTTYKPPGGTMMNRVAIGPYLDKPRAERLQRELSERYEIDARLMAFGN